MKSVDDHLVGMANSFISIWNRRLELIDGGYMTTFETIDGEKVDTTKQTRAELEELIKYQQDFIKTRGAVRVA